MQYKAAAVGKLSYRHENKYLIDNSEMLLLKARFESLIEHDPSAGEIGEYKVRSIYFDDYWDTAYEEKVMGTLNRCKYRIRAYNDSDANIKLERKLKYGAYIAKQSAKLNREEAERIISGDYGFLFNSPQPLCREFYYESVAKMMRPRVIVDYDREPYVYDPGEVRITFDKDVRAAMLRFDLFDPDLPSMGVLEPNQCILEVKFTELLPNFIREVLPRRLGQILSLSKYTMVRDKLSYMSVRQSY